MIEDAPGTVDDALAALAAAERGRPRPRRFLARWWPGAQGRRGHPTAWEPLVERGLALVGGERDLLWARLTLLQDHSSRSRAALLVGAIGWGATRQLLRWPGQRVTKRLRGRCWTRSIVAHVRKPTSSSPSPDRGRGLPLSCERWMWQAVICSTGTALP